MSDDTILNAGTGGDTIRTDELIDPSTNLPFAKVQAVKLMTGGDGIDGGVVTKQNPLPVEDSSVIRELQIMNAFLARICKALEIDTL